MVKAVIFDFDDTIGNTNQCIELALKHSHKTFRQYFPGISEKVLIKTNLQAFNELRLNQKLPSYQVEILVWHRIFEILGIPYSMAVIYKLFRAFHQYIAGHISFGPGFIELFKFLKKQKIKVGILSNGSFEVKIERLKHLGLADENIYLVSSDMVGVEKPNLEPFLYILAKLKVTPRESMFVGDSIYFDIDPAIKLGMTPVLFMPGYFPFPKEDLKSIKFKVKNHIEIIDIIKNILTNKSK